MYCQRGKSPLFVCVGLVSIKKKVPGAAVYNMGVYIEIACGVPLLTAQKAPKSRWAVRKYPGLFFFLGRVLGSFVLWWASWG